jgi:hypothetical protein
VPSEIPDHVATPIDKAPDPGLLSQCRLCEQAIYRRADNEKWYHMHNGRLPCEKVALVWG